MQDFLLCQEPRGAAWIILAGSRGFWRAPRRAEAELAGRPPLPRFQGRNPKPPSVSPRIQNECRSVWRKAECHRSTRREQPETRCGLRDRCSQFCVGVRSEEILGCLLELDPSVSVETVQGSDLVLVRWRKELPGIRRQKALSMRATLPQLGEDKMLSVGVFAGRAGIVMCDLGYLVPKLAISPTSILPSSDRSSHTTNTLNGGMPPEE